MMPGDNHGRNPHTCCTQGWETRISSGWIFTCWRLGPRPTAFTLGVTCALDILITLMLGLKP